MGRHISGSLRQGTILAVSADLSGYRITRYDDFFVNIQDIRVK